MLKMILQKIEGIDVIYHSNFDFLVSFIKVNRQDQYIKIYSFFVYTKDSIEKYFSVGTHSIEKQGTSRDIYPIEDTIRYNVISFLNFSVRQATSRSILYYNKGLEDQLLFYVLFKIVEDFSKEVFSSRIYGGWLCLNFTKL